MSQSPPTVGAPLEGRTGQLRQRFRRSVARGAIRAPARPKPIALEHHHHGKPTHHRQQASSYGANPFGPPVGAHLEARTVRITEPTAGRSGLCSPCEANPVAAEPPHPHHTQGPAPASRSTSPETTPASIAQPTLPGTLSSTVPGYWQKSPHLPPATQKQYGAPAGHPCQRFLAPLHAAVRHDREWHPAHCRHVEEEHPS